MNVSLLNEGVAILIETGGEHDQTPPSRCWQAYDSDGRLTAVVHLSADQQQALLFNYQIRQACHLTSNRSGRLHNRGEWTI